MKMKPAKKTLLLNAPVDGTRVAIYSRVSTDDQDVQNQIAQLKQYAAAQHWEVVEIITDVCSGAKDASERNGLGRLLVLAHQRRFDIALFWSLDRFSREGSRKTIGYLTQLESFGVDFHSFTEPYLSTLGVFSDAIIAFLSALAKQERLRIGERTKAGLERAKANGKRLGRPRVPEERTREARALRGQGLSFGEIGRRLECSRVRAFQLCNTGSRSSGGNTRIRRRHK